MSAATPPEQREAETPLTTPTATSGRSRNYIVRHWNGDLSLGISYWVNLVLISNGLPFLFFAAVREFFEDRWSLRVVAIVMFSALLATLAIWAWGVDPKRP